jgi:hypothetical protein
MKQSLTADILISEESKLLVMKPTHRNAPTDPGLMFRQHSKQYPRETLFPKYVNNIVVPCTKYGLETKTFEI